MTEYDARPEFLIPEGMPQRRGNIVTQLIAKCPEPDCDMTCVTLSARSDFGYNKESTVIYSVMEGKAMYWRSEGGRLRSQTLFAGDTVVVPPGITYSMVPLERAPVTFLTFSTPHFDSEQHVFVALEEMLRG